MLEVTFLIGHRGTGKTSLLKRLQSYQDQDKASCDYFDLDACVEKASGSKISDLFDREGEAAFRQLEISNLMQLLKDLHENNRTQNKTYISIGAGFEGSLDFSDLYPNTHFHVLWVKRPTDKKGRVFLDRPPLDKALPLQSFLDRFPGRESRYRNLFTKLYFMDEGWRHENLYEKKLLLKRPPPQGDFKNNKCVIFTALPLYFENKERLHWFLETVKDRPELYVELRDDLLCSEQIQEALEKLPENKTLLSLRKESSFKKLLDLPKKALFVEDRGMEADSESKFEFHGTRIRSLHKREKDEPVMSCIEKLQSKKADIYKLAIPIHNLTELLEGHRWFVEKPETRAFCPISNNGRWKFYRQHWGRRSPLHYIHLGFHSAADQPSYFEYLKDVSQDERAFSCVMGSPLEHSHTPAEHHEFFKRHGMNVYRVELTDEEVSKKSIAQLKELGMRFAAVTSPIKKKVFEICAESTEIASEFSSINTLAWCEKSQKWMGTNTDIEGLKKLLIQTEKAGPSTDLKIVWGGGGTRPALRKLLPRAIFLSSRTGAVLDEASALPTAMTKTKKASLIWALGRNRHKGRWPESAFKETEFPKIKLVVDLNYSEDSPGREYAIHMGAEYLSGELMFKEQAAFQRKFWANFIKEMNKEPL